MKTAAASVINASASERPDAWNRIRKTREFLRKLSLKAEKNWVQNKGAKRRVRSRDEDIGGSGRWIGSERPDALPRQVPAAYRGRGAKRRQFGPKDNLAGQNGRMKTLESTPEVVVGGPAEVLRRARGCPGRRAAKCRYPRRVRRASGCIMIAATLRQTAAPVANVKSEIHMRASLVLFSGRGHRVRERAVNAQPEYPFLELR